MFTSTPPLLKKFYVCVFKLYVYTEQLGVSVNLHCEHSFDFSFSFFLNQYIMWTVTISNLFFPMLTILTEKDDLFSIIEKM